MRFPIKLLFCLSTALPVQAHAAVSLIAMGTIATNGNHDMSGLDYSLENGLQADFFGGVGSGLAYAGGNTFLGLPDRGPNATPFPNGAAIDNTVSWISRFQTMQLELTPSASGSALPFALTTKLSGTTLLWSAAPLIYGDGSAYSGGVAGNWINNVPGTPAGTHYFSGRSDNFGPGNSLNPAFARLDPEALRVSSDGKSIFMSDEYGPYVRQFDRETGELIKTFELPEHLAISNLFPTVSDERNTANNVVGRFTNSGMEGLAITPDGKTLVGAIQGALLQDRIGGASNLLRLIKIDIETGAVTEYAYLANTGTGIGISEIIAINDHQFLVGERDGSGLGGNPAGAVMKNFYLVDISGATPITTEVGLDAAALAIAKSPTPFIDLVSALTAFGIPASQIPSKIEGLAFGQDVMIDGVLTHTLYISDDNDFVPETSGPNHFYVFGFTADDLPGYQAQQIAAVPEPASWAMMIAGFGVAGAAMRRRKSTTAVRFA